MPEPCGCETGPHLDCGRCHDVSRAMSWAEVERWVMTEDAPLHVLRDLAAVWLKAYDGG